MNVSSQQLGDALAEIGASGDIIVVRQLSRRVTLLEARAPDQQPRLLLLRRHSLRDRQRNPNIARDEYKLLRRLRDAGMPVARPLFLRADGETPFLLTEYVAGESRFAPNNLSAFCEQLAQILSTIHSFDIAKHDLSFLPSQRNLIADELRSIAADSLGIGRAMASALPQIAMNATTLLHGDFWLGNLLWRGDELAAIIDWEDAMLGDPLGDLGKCRLETLWALGAEGMARFTASYIRRNPQLDLSALPFWDLWGALRLSHFADWTDDSDRVARMSGQYHAFVRDAIIALETPQK